MNPLLVLPEGVEIFDFDASSAQPQLLVASHGKHYQVTGAIAVEILRELGIAPCSLNELKLKLRSLISNEQDLPDFELAVERLRERGFIQIDGHVASPSLELSNQRKSGYFALKLNVIPPGKLRPITQMLSPAFSPDVMFIALPTLAALLGLYWLRWAMPVTSLLPRVGGFELAILLFCNYLGLFLHEVGHAAACVRNGARHGYVGVGLYLVFPVFFTDVSESWRVPRRRRIAIDAGGIYMSLALAVISAIAALATRSVICGLWCFLNTLIVIANVNPFVRMDGYWMVSDALGVPSLMNSNRELTRWLALRSIGVPSDRPKILNIPRVQRYLYFAYYLGFCFFAVWFVYQFVGWYLPHLSSAFRDTVSVLTGSSVTLSNSFRQVLRLLVRSVPILGLSIYAGRSLMKLVAQVRMYGNLRLDHTLKDGQRGA